MKIYLHPPLSIHDQGQRENNEDCIYPNAAASSVTADTRMFLVCDGVGGLEKGEVASRIVCETLWDTLRFLEVPGEKEINYAIGLAEQRIDQFIIRNQEAQGMATTLTMLSVHREGVTIAHVGDSRVYQFRNGDCLFKTHDHSLINELMGKNIITPEEAKNHPKRNVITKAISGYTYHQVPDVELITDVQKGDYFFLCTDGILESLSDESLSDIFRSNNSNEEKIKWIAKECKERSKDNFSAYLIQIKEVEKELIGASKFTWPQWKNKKQSNLFYTSLAIVLGIAAGFFIQINNNKKGAEEQANRNAALEMLQDIDTMDIFIRPRNEDVLTDTVLDEERIIHPSPQERRKALEQMLEKREEDSKTDKSNLQ